MFAILSSFQRTCQMFKYWHASIIRWASTKNQYQYLIKHEIGVAATVCMKSRNAKCFLLTTVSNDTITQWMMNENIKVVIINIRRLTVCSSNLNVNAGMNLVPLNKTVTLIELMYYEQMCYKYSALSSMLE